MTFEALAQCLNPDERLRLELALNGENLTVLLQPVLKAAPDHLNDDQRRLRVALSHPLRLSSPASALDATLITALTAYGEKRHALQSSADELETLDEALRQAQQAVHGKRQKAAKASPEGTLPASGVDAAAVDAATSDTAPSAATPAPAPAVSENTNPDSLF